MSEPSKESSARSEGVAHAGAGPSEEAAAGAPGASGHDRLCAALRALRRGATEELRSALVAAAGKLLDERHPDAAARALERLAALEPGPAEAETELGLRAVEQGLAAAGAPLALRGLRALEARGESAATRRARRALEEAPCALPAEVDEALARDRASAQQDDAAALFLRAARARRRGGEPVRALALCDEAAKHDEEAAGLARERGLALLQSDEAERALPDLREWRRRDRWSPEAHAACTQALWECEQVASARSGFGALTDVTRLRDARNRRLAALELGRRLEAADPIWRTRLVPFWEAEEIWEDRGTAEAGDEAEAGGARGGRPGRWVAVAPDTHIYRKRLSMILAEAGYEVTTAANPQGLCETLAGCGTAPDLAILGLRSGDVAPLRELREAPGLGRVPVLGLTTLDRSGLDLAELRRLGVVGLLDKSSTPEHVLFRVNGVTGPEASTRRFVRAPAFFPVDVRIGEEWHTEYATNLSVGGLGLATDTPYEANTDITLRFRLREGRGTEVEREGRIVYCRARPGAPPYEVGLFFHQTDDETRAKIEREVERLLDDRFEVPSGSGRQP